MKWSLSVDCIYMHFIILDACYNYIYNISTNLCSLYTILFLAEIPHQLSSADPITTENSAYCRGEDSQAREELCKCGLYMHFIILDACYIIIIIDKLMFIVYDFVSG